MSKLSHYIFLLFLYLYLFNPFFGIFTGNFHFGNLFPLFALLLFLFKKSDVTLKYIHLFHKEFFLIMYLLFFTFMRSGIRGETPIITQHVIGFINIFMILPFIIDYIKRKRIDTSQYIVRSLLVVGTIASVITLFCVLMPELNIYLKRVVMHYSTDELNNEMNDYRGFGFASLLSSDYGFIMGLLLVLGCFYHKTNKWFIYFMPLIILAALVNARTGLVIALTGLLFFFISNRNLKYSIALVLLSVFIYNFSYELMSLLNLNEKTVDWLTYTYESTSDALTSGDISQSQSLTALFVDFWILPDDAGQWLIGRGFDLFRNTQGVPPSDVGWIRELNYGGLFYLIPLILLWVLMFRRLYNTNNKAFALFFFATVCIINTKTIIFPGSRSFYILVLLYFLSFVQSNKYLKKPHPRDFSQTVYVKS